MLPGFGDAGFCCAWKKPRVRLAEVIVVEAVNPRRDAVLQRPLADALFIRTAAGRRLMVRNDLIAAERLMLRRGVGQYQGMLVRLVAEVVRNPSSSIRRLMKSRLDS